NPNDGELERRIDRAMMFNVGGDAGAIAAKGTLREIEDRCLESLARFDRERSAAARTSRDQKTRLENALQKVRP
ncbi:MAG: hypothetical protein ABL932_15105, partial [Terricaulis sp.]